MLSKGYGMPVKNTPSEVYYDIHGGKVQWALGMMLAEQQRVNRIVTIICTDMMRHDVYTDSAPLT